MRARLVGPFLLVVALASSSLAQDRRGGPSLDRVLPQIARSVPGTFYDAEGPFLTPDGRANYRIKWMTPEGRIIWFSVDARTGQVIGNGAPSARGYENRSDDRDRPRTPPPRTNWRDDGGNDWNRGGQDWNRDRDRQDWNRNRERPDWNRNRDGQDWNRSRDGQDWNRNRGGQGDTGRRRDSDHNGDRNWNGNRGGHDWNGGRDRGSDRDRRHGG